MIATPRLRGYVYGAIIVVFLVAGYVALGYGPRSKSMPLFACAMGILLAVWGIFADRRARREERELDPNALPDDFYEDSPPLNGLILSVIWFASLLVLVILAGALVGGALFMIAYLVVVGRISIVRATIGAAALIGWFLILHYAIGLQLPNNLLGSLTGVII